MPAGTVCYNRRDAVEFVRGLRRGWNNIGASTLCVLYNGAGEDLTLHSSHDWSGNMAQNACYPDVIRNWGWAAFFHVNPLDENFSGSTGAVVYRGKKIDWMLAWDSPLIQSSGNKVYAEIRKADYFDKADWSQIGKSLESGACYDVKEFHGCIAKVLYANEENTPIWTGMISRYE